MACVIVSALRSCAGEQRFVSCCVLRVLSAASCTYWLSKIKVAEFDMASCVTVPTMTLARKVSPGLQDLQTQARRILAERNAEKAEENTWIGRMIAAENINEIEALIKSHDSV